MATLTVPFGDPDAGLQPGAGRRGVGGVPALPDPEEQQQAEAASDACRCRPRRCRVAVVVVDRQLRHGRLGPGGGQQLATSRPAGHKKRKVCTAAASLLCLSKRGWIGAELAYSLRLKPGNENDLPTLLNFLACSNISCHFSSFSLSLSLSLPICIM